MKLSNVPLKDIRPGFTVVKEIYGKYLGVVAEVSDADGEDRIIIISWGQIDKDGKSEMSRVWHFSAIHIEVVLL